VLVSVEGVKNVYDFELLVLRPVNSGLIHEIVEGNDVVIAEKRHDLHDSILLYFNLILADETVGSDELAAKLFLDRIHERTRPRLLLRPLRLRRYCRLCTRRRGRRFWNGGLGLNWSLGCRWGCRRFGGIRRLNRCLLASLVAILLFFCHFLGLGRN
jgi:hypothetical protein